MPDLQALVTDFVLKLKRRKIEGSQATAKQTAELLRQVVSQQRMPYTNQASVLIDAVRAVGEQLIAANPIGELSNSSLFWLSPICSCLFEAFGGLRMIDQFLGSQK
ncbi:hypothetical protein BHE74_00044480 [Ensete ventricosum]|uniref:Uncharacterized protein n=1 Tax=Ensete ventricosum TaxID=4639 RepID=A0A444FFW1_ENSVE|nr:hypothetical protein B296_00020562 [Ensete ventricosum]RWW21515.1 hypothetical protein GW17_00014328 [Ensete ventricosum]RWW49376.1 hypothetical protein BHE74_00044480 [Ensete ventricosum]RZS27230.1 hypothetical protein BHM03_00060667 [Ensete ventricosum]